MHMLSHQVGAGQAADSQRLTFLENECARLQLELEAERKERVIAEAVSRERVRQLEAELIRQQAELAAVPRLRAQLASEQMRLEAQRNRELEAALGAQGAQAEALRRERDTLAEERDALERMLLPTEAHAEPCSEQCAG